MPLFIYSSKYVDLPCSCLMRIVHKVGKKKNIHCNAVNNEGLIPFLLFSTSENQELAHGLTYSVNLQAVSLGKQNLGFPMVGA